MIKYRNISAMTPGGTIQETTQLNIESLWSGGPFADSVSSINQQAHGTSESSTIYRVTMVETSNPKSRPLWPLTCRGFDRRFSPSALLTVSRHFSFVWREEPIYNDEQK